MHVRCPHCHNAIEIVGEDDFTDVTCPSCGSIFNLLPTTATFKPATRSIGHFQLLEQVGSGSFGSVWKARDTKLDRVVAIKIPRRDQVDGNTDLFLREARAAAQLKHSSIVPVHEVGREDGTLYIVSDFVQGVTLADRLGVRPFSPREAADLCARIADAIQHAHHAGVIHRDLKPSNIMLDGNGSPHVMDFGLAKRESGEITITVEGKVLGTPAYMSPEQASGEGHHVDWRSDVYSLGVILFEMLTGERPFRGNQRMLLHQKLHEDAPHVRRLNGSVPRDLDTIIAKCLERTPERRYATAAEFGADLRSFLAGEAIRARPAGRIERAWRWYRRNVVVGTLAAVLMLTILAALATTTWLWRRADTAVRLADEAGALIVTDPNRLHARATLTNEFRRPERNPTIEQSWFVYVPKGDRYQLVVAVGGIPEQGFPAERESYYFPPWKFEARDSGKVVLMRVSMVRRSSGRWDVGMEQRNRIGLRGVHFPVPTNYNQSWDLTDQSDHHWRIASKVTSVVQHDSDPLVLFRWKRWPQYAPGSERLVPMPSVSEGMMIWIEPFDDTGP